MGSIKVGTDPRLPALQAQPGFWERFRARMWEVLRDLAIAVNEHVHTIRPRYTAPTTLTVTTGTLSAGTVSDLAAPGGTLVNVSEAASTPGFNVEVVFSKVVGTPIGFAWTGRYEGNTAHVVTVDAYNYTSAAWEPFGLAESRTDNRAYSYLYPRGTDYVNSGAAKFRFYHVTAGVGTHDLYLDYCTIIAQESI